MGINFISFVDTFISDHGKQDQTFLLRGRVLVSLSLMYLASLIFLVIVFTVLAILNIFSLWAVVISSTISSIFYVGQLVYFKRSGNLFWAANMGMCTMCIATAIFVLITGGWESPVTMIFMCTSVCAFLMEGRNSGIFWSLMIGLAYGLFFLLQGFGFEFNSVIPSDLTDYLIFGSWVYSWAIIFGGMAIYGGLARGLNDALSVERERLRNKATYDVATGVYNRTAFYKLLGEQVLQASQSGRSFVLLDIEVLANSRLSGEYEEEMLVKAIRSLESHYPCRIILGRGSSLSLFALIDEVNEPTMALEVVATVQNIMGNIFIEKNIQVVIGAVMVPAYSNNLDEVILAVRKAMQDARKSPDQYMLYTDEQRRRFKKWSDKNWLKRSYAEFAIQTGFLLP